MDLSKVGTFQDSDFSAPKLSPVMRISLLEFSV